MANDDDVDVDDVESDIEFGVKVTSIFLDANENAHWGECSKTRQQVATADFLMHSIAIVVVAVLVCFFDLMDCFDRIGFGLLYSTTVNG